MPRGRRPVVLACSTIPASSMSPSTSGTASAGMPTHRCGSARAGSRGRPGRRRVPPRPGRAAPPARAPSATRAPSHPPPAGGRRIARADTAAPGAIGLGRSITSAMVDTGTRRRQPASRRDQRPRHQTATPEPFDGMVPGGQRGGTSGIEDRRRRALSSSHPGGASPSIASTSAGSSGRSEIRTPCPSTTTRRLARPLGRDTVSKDSKSDTDNGGLP